MISLKDKVSGSMVFFLITASQVGVGVLGFQSVINKYAEQDAWMSLIVAGGAVSVIIWIMYGMLSNNAEGDIAAIHEFTYGKWLGAFFTILFSAYLLLMALVVLRTYIEIIQVWMFPHVKVWALLLLIIPLIYYTTADKFRAVVGVCFLGVVYPLFLILSFLFPLRYARLTNILPVMDHSFMEIMQSSSIAILEFMGLAVLLVFYPFIREAKQSQKFAHFGNLSTTALYLLICVISYLYYDQSEMENLIWGTLNLWKIIELPFMDRFEYFGIATLFFSILPNIALFVWASARSLNRVFGFAQAKMTGILLFILFIACLISGGRQGINFLNDITGTIGLWFLFAYIPVLFFINFIRRKVQKDGG
ncbi:GerAB/ArcD/ProY family transporter [Lentibacillus cibarius]|uniref:GerAB/ArcD/ProY family transporter n=1 Tax=Lentibacillus cibarius TaxID=2583219 RepID=A0A549YJY3_9BACI|nr:GerAB/ArcD/ProY family transporter [Lentibacillus cibarius]TRM12199.1 GerAB/ArcD/ProY family transporter [Lentibacillus cibarius]